MRGGKGGNRGDKVEPHHATHGEKKAGCKLKERGSKRIDRAIENDKKEKSVGKRYKKEKKDGR